MCGYTRHLLHIDPFRQSLQMVGPNVRMCLFSTQILPEFLNRLLRLRIPLPCVVPQRIDRIYQRFVDWRRFFFGR